MRIPPDCQVFNRPSLGGHFAIIIDVFGLAALGIGTTGVFRSLIESYASVFMALFFIGCPPLLLSDCYPV